MGESLVTIPRIVSMASFPPRIAGLERVVRDLLPQCDGMRIYLNGYDAIPGCLPDDPKLEIVLAGPNSKNPDKSSFGKWHWLGREDCYHLTVDDDIFYAPGYVDHMVAGCRRLRDRAIVGLHGYSFRHLVGRGQIDLSHNLIHSRQMSFYHKAVLDDLPMHVLGSGLMCMHPASIGITTEDLPINRASGDDEELALWAQRGRIPMVRIASPADLATPNHTEWPKGALCLSHAFRQASAIKLRSYRTWTLHP